MTFNDRVMMMTLFPSSPMSAVLTSHIVLSSFRRQTEAVELISLQNSIPSISLYFEIVNHKSHKKTNYKYGPITLECQRHVSMPSSFYKKKPLVLGVTHYDLRIPRIE